MKEMFSKIQTPEKLVPFKLYPADQAVVIEVLIRMNLSIDQAVVIEVHITVIHLTDQTVETEVLITVIPQIDQLVIIEALITVIHLTDQTVETEVHIREMIDPTVVIKVLFTVIVIGPIVVTEALITVTHQKDQIVVTEVHTTVMCPMERLFLEKLIWTTSTLTLKKWKKVNKRVRLRSHTGPCLT